MLRLELFPEIPVERQKFGWMNTKTSIMQQCLQPEMYLMASKCDIYLVSVYLGLEVGNRNQ